jgi:hypothetical protein
MITNEPGYGDKTIRVTIAFNYHTKGKHKPKHITEGGWLYIQTNHWHGLTPDTQDESFNFNSLAEIPKVLVDLLLCHGVKLRPGPQTRELYEGAAAIKAWETMKGEEAA